MHVDSKYRSKARARAPLPPLCINYFIWIATADENCPRLRARYYVRIINSAPKYPARGAYRRDDKIRKKREGVARIWPDVIHRVAAWLYFGRHSLFLSRKLPEPAMRVRDHEIKGKVCRAHPRGWCAFACKGWREREGKERAIWRRQRLATRARNTNVSSDRSLQNYECIISISKSNCKSGNLCPVHETHTQWLVLYSTTHISFGH